MTETDKKFIENILTIDEDLSKITKALAEYSRKHNLDYYFIVFDPPQPEDSSVAIGFRGFKNGKYGEIVNNIIWRQYADGFIGPRPNPHLVKKTKKE